MQGIILMEPPAGEGGAQAWRLIRSRSARSIAPKEKLRRGRNANGKRAHATSAFLKEAFDRGAEQFQWKARIAQNKRSGTKVRGVGVSTSGFFAGSTGYDGLFSHQTRWPDRTSSPASETSAPSR